MTRDTRTLQEIRNDTSPDQKVRNEVDAVLAKTSLRSVDKVTALLTVIQDGIQTSLTQIKHCMKDFGEDGSSHDPNVLARYLYWIAASSAWADEMRIFADSVYEIVNKQISTQGEKQ